MSITFSVTGPSSRRADSSRDLFAGYFRIFCQPSEPRRLDIDEPPFKANLYNLEIICNFLLPVVALLRLDEYLKTCRRAPLKPA
jgi:hypothetical protein